MRRQELIATAQKECLERLTSSACSGCPQRLQAMMMVLKVRASGSTPCAQVTCVFKVCCWVCPVGITPVSSLLISPEPLTAVGNPTPLIRSINSPEWMLVGWHGAAHLLINDVQNSNSILPAPSLAHGIDERVEGHYVCLETISLPHGKILSPHACVSRAFYSAPSLKSCRVSL